jgi:hypothetical protein
MLTVLLGPVVVTLARQFVKVEQGAALSLDWAK